MSVRGLPCAFQRWKVLFPDPGPPPPAASFPATVRNCMATAMWGPVLAWSVLELLAESVNAEDPKRAALDLFDRLRLREPLAHAFEALGFAGEESWRVAARIKVALLIEAKVFAPEEQHRRWKIRRARSASRFSRPRSGRTPMFAGSPEFTTPTDHSYFVKESYEELLWWLQLPALCKLAAESMPSRSAIQQIGNAISEAVKTAVHPRAIA